MKVLNLFVKHPGAGGDRTPVDCIQCDLDGICGSTKAPPMRHILITQKSILDEFDLFPGDLKENIVVDFNGLHQLKSGIIIKIGSAKLRLTFHCEPCKVIANKVNLGKIAHKRGVLFSVIQKGFIAVGDNVVITDEYLEEIPYEIGDRIEWYLSKNSDPIHASNLLWEIGLSNSYARALPRLIAKLPEQYQKKVLYKSHQRTTEPCRNLDLFQVA